MGTSHTSN